MTKQQEHTLNWHDQDCPELLRRDPRMFSVSELLQIILGYRKEEDDKLCNLMELCDQKIDRLRMLSTADLKHLGFAQKEIDALLAALELGKRQWDIEKEEKNKTISSFLEDFKKTDELVDYFNQFDEDLSKKNLNSFSKSVINKQ